MSQEHELGIEQAINLVATCAEIMFQHAPAMLIAMNEEGAIVKVSEKWLASMGYEAKEVLGRKSTEFMTAEEEENQIRSLSNQRQQLLLLAETVENTMAKVIADVATMDAE